MNAVHIFLAEISTSVIVSALVLARLQSLLRRVGNEVCEHNGGATEFWVAYTQLMMMIAPLLLIAILSQSAKVLDPVQHVQSSLAVVLMGQVAGLILVGRAVWTSIVRPVPKAEGAPVPMSGPLATSH